MDTGYDSEFILVPRIINTIFAIGHFFTDHNFNDFQPKSHWYTNVKTTVIVSSSGLHLSDYLSWSPKGDGWSGLMLALYG